MFSNRTDSALLDRIQASQSSFVPSSGLADPIATSAQQTVSSSNLITNNQLVAQPLTVLPSDTITSVLFNNNSIETATVLGNLAGTITRSGWVGSTDTDDYYRITLTGLDDINVSLTGLSADADVTLYNNLGHYVTGSSRGGTADEAINVADQGSGDYYVRVRSYAGTNNTSYTLRMSNTTPSNLLPTETNVGSLSGTEVFSGSINNLDTSDTYRFSVSNLDFGFISIPRTVNVTLSGMSGDLDLRLIQDANNNGVVDSGDVLTSSSLGGKNAEWMSRTLATGSYFVQVNQYGSANSNYHLSISTGDWYSSNLSDAGVIGEARYADHYGGISRNDMLSILREAKDGSAITGTELTDLRTLLTGKGSIMPESVRVLSNKLLNGDLANGRSGIGNLFAGSSDTQMENLIGKWFLGNDRPDAAGTYRYASGSLFQGGVSYTDIDQGSVGDCYFLAALGSTAYQSPSMIQNMFTDNGDGTFTVRFFNNGVADYVTVDRYLPTNGSDNRIYAGWGGGSYSEANNELWVALAEKAYAQVNESGWLGRSVSENSYSSIGWGNGGNAMREITGQATEGRGVPTDWLAGDLIERSVLINSLNAGAKITMGTLDFGLADSRVVADHEYSLVGYNSTTGRFKLFNPWGVDSGAANPGILELTWDEIQANFGYWSRTV